MGGVQACKALDLVRKAAVLVASLEQLAPHCMEPLMMLVQQLPMLLPNLQHPPSVTAQESARMSQHRMLQFCYGSFGAEANGASLGVLQPQTSTLSF